MAAESPEIILRIIHQSDIRKLTLNARPASVDTLINILKNKLELDQNFKVHYEDPDFDGKLTTLCCIEELPKKAVIHIIPETNTCSSPCNEMLVPSPESRGSWPSGPFPIPTFSYDVELTLKRANEEYEQRGRQHQCTWDQKHNILEQLATTIVHYKAYPSDQNLAAVAEALVTKHPCLKEVGCGSGFEHWKISLNYKMSNFRNKLRRAGCLEVSVNAGRRSKREPEKESPHSNIKKPRRAEVNFLPNFPQGESAATLEKMREELVEETKKAERNRPLISSLMQRTFALRRKTMIMTSPPVKEVLSLWPALQIESEVCAEFHRITNKNLKNTFYAQLDMHTPRLMSLLRWKATKTGKAAENLAKILSIFNEQETQDVHSKRTTVLAGLPIYLREDASGFYKSCLEEDEEAFRQTCGVALVTTVAGGETALVHYGTTQKVAVVLEGQVFFAFPRLADSFVMMFGLMYVLHLNYPKEMNGTFDFIQKILFGLDEKKLSPKLMSLKHELLKTV